VGHHIEDVASQGLTSFTACSALKRRYRDVLRGYVPALVFIDLDASRASIAARLEHRSRSFMPPSLLDSQFADLEPLESDERGLIVNAELTPDEIVSRVASYLSAA
jgi:gluconokinase